MISKIVAMLTTASLIFTSFFPFSKKTESTPTDTQNTSCIFACDKVAGAPVPSAKGAYLMHFESGGELYSLNEDLMLPMASTTKLMTAIIVSELLPFDKIVTVDEQSVGIEGSSIYLFAGERISVEVLMYGLLLESANDAATALAIECAGSIDNFCSLMNKKAHDLGLTSTSFKNPHGLDHEEHYTTPKELALIAAYALRDERIAGIVSSKSYKAQVVGSDTYRYMTNHNRLLSSYDGAIGMKTGFTKRTGRCLVSAARRDGMTLICVTLGAQNDWQAHHDLLDFGFNNYKVIPLVQKGDISLALDITGGESSQVALTNRDTLTALINKNTTAHEIRLDIRINRPIFAPIAQNKILGFADVIYRSEHIFTLQLTSEENIEAKKPKSSIINKIKEFFAGIFDLPK